MPKETKDLYLYRFVVANPPPNVIDILPELGVQLMKEQCGIWYLCSSFIDHKQAEFICRKTGIVATSYKKIKNIEIHCKGEKR